MHTQAGNGAAQRGFTLVELMVVVAIMAILSTFAVNSYRSYALRATRTEARLALLAIQAAQEKFFLQNNQYAPDMATVQAAPPAGLGVALGSGNTTLGGHYVISFAAVTANTYTLQAVATGTQTNDNSSCLTYTITDQGVRTPADSSGCWK
jgi:type IV pilus assembly protein PilE